MSNLSFSSSRTAREASAYGRFPAVRFAFTAAACRTALWGVRLVSRGSVAARSVLAPVEAALVDAVRFVRSQPYNPVMAEAYVRGDFADFARQLTERPGLFREKYGWSARQIRKALPLLRRLT